MHDDDRSPGRPGLWLCGSGASVHPIHRATASVSAALDGVAGTPAWSMSPAEQRSTLVDLAVVEARVCELRLRVLAAGDVNQVGAETGASSTAAWVAHQTRQTHRQAHRDLRVAIGLDRDHEATRTALASGAVNLAQAQVIVTALARLSTDIPAEKRLEAERWLIGEAGFRDAEALSMLGKRLFEVIDPESADEVEGRILAEQERRARQSAYFSISSNGDGTSGGRFKLPDLHAAILTKALQTLTAPRRTGDARVDPDTGKTTPYPVLLGQGFMELLEHLPVDRLPVAGGIAATVVVTLDHDSLLSGIGAATLDTGTRISAGEARRLACGAGIIPIVLGGDSMPLDVGRERRLHTRAQRIAIAHRDRGCVAETCDRPPAWCEAHHPEPWATGGETTLSNGQLLCGHHHRLAHHDGYHNTQLPNGQVRFRRRQ